MEQSKDCTAHCAGQGEFARRLTAAGLGPVLRGRVTTIQANLGKQCNLACVHCHQQAGPRATESAGPEVARAMLGLMERSPAVELLDLTGGAPELNPSFRMLVEGARRLGRKVINRSNLAVLLEPGMEDLPEFLAEQGVDIVASLPCYTAENVDQQRGGGVFERCIPALQRLNALGYGEPGTGLELNLVYNPGGAFLPGPQEQLQSAYVEQLRGGFGIEFNRLFIFANLPIGRFARSLERSGELEQYRVLLDEGFNACTVPELMCRSLVSVRWDGTLFDCDFNIALDLPLRLDDGSAATVFGVESLKQLEGRVVTTADHCFGCTAGAGSSCSGALL